MENRYNFISKLWQQNTAQKSIKKINDEYKYLIKDVNEEKSKF